MKRRILLLFVSVIGLLAMAGTNYTVISEVPLNVRESASSDAEILGTLNSGTSVEVVSKKNDWAKIRYNGGYGFVKIQFIQPEAISENKSSSRDNGNSSNFPDNTVAIQQGPATAESDFESQRNKGWYELYYNAGSFEDVKESGMYGFAWTLLEWKLAPQLYGGIHFSPINLNYGLSDFNYCAIKLGPALGYYFTPTSFISAPLDIICDVYFGDKGNQKTAWGMALSPSLFVGKKGGVFLGPQFSIGFSGKSKVFCGFLAGIFF